MKPEQQRIAIAEACGWQFLIETRVGKPPYTVLTVITSSGMILCECFTSTIPAFVMKNIPNYTGDLNAMHDAEKFLIDLGMSLIYMDNLANIASRECQYVIMATAAQRAEAFLRTLHLWEDEN